jgi:hypothetical protein
LTPTSRGDFMRPVHFVVAAFTSMSLTGAPRAVELTGQPSVPPKQSAVQKVRMVVATAGAHAEQCTAGKYQPVDILVDANPKNNDPSHCVMGAVLDHASAHKYDATILKLSFKARDSVLWYSDAEFQIVAIEPHEDKEPGLAPKNPFMKPILKIPSTSLESGPIQEAAVNHRYKITFMVNGRTIDPDLWCNP